ncbi:DNA-directed RNA polymerase III subunit RPC8 [Clarias magur]|uniref:DNA-directed RNA polymerase subunit n=1 Tax=Clarias magur TaxID=1594786 RepID=A0A8J4UXZ1_CLAMG|nr:DNA-directed RNA polymerase III subunit RPC8 [Clarias magur]
MESGDESSQDCTVHPTLLETIVYGHLDDEVGEAGLQIEAHRRGNHSLEPFRPDFPSDCTFRMFVLVEMIDTVRIPPWNFHRQLNDAISEELNKKLANKVVYNVGLCICLYDITKLEDSYIFPGDGASHTKVHFRYVVFHPFLDEVLVGKIKYCSQEGVYAMKTSRSGCGSTRRTKELTTSTWTRVRRSDSGSWTSCFWIRLRPDPPRSLRHRSKLQALCLRPLRKTGRRRKSLPIRCWPPSVSQAWACCHGGAANETHRYSCSGHLYLCIIGDQRARGVSSFLLSSAVLRDIPSESCAHQRPAASLWCSSALTSLCIDVRSPYWILTDSSMNQRVRRDHIDAHQICMSSCATLSLE